METNIGNSNKPYRDRRVDTISKEYYSKGLEDLSNIRSDWCQNNNQRNVNLNDHNKDNI